MHITGMALGKKCLAGHDAEKMIMILVESINIINIIVVVSLDPLFILLLCLGFINFVKIFLICHYASCM